MDHRSTTRRWRLVILLAVASLAFAACGSNKEETTSGAGAGGGTASTQGEGGGGAPADKVVKIGLIAPLSGDLSALGLGMRNSVDLAVKQANAQNKVQGWRVEFDPQDDTAKADVGAQVATRLASDPAVVGVVGTLNSSVAQQVQPILDQASIAMISPANTNPTLSQGQDPANPQRPYKSYFRVATTDLVQGPFAADYLYDTAGVRSVAVIHDKKTYGQGLTDAFKTEFTKKGGQVLATETINPGDKDFSSVLSKIKPLNPQAIYYGGEYPEASLISSQAKQQGLNVPLMGGDGIYDKTYITTAGAAANGDLATSVGAPTESLGSAKAFVDQYKAANYGDDYSAYGAYAYDAANAIIEAMAKVLPGKSAIDESVRTDVVAAVQNTNLDGVTGKVSFDQYGDTTTKVLTVYKVEGDAWKPVNTGEFGA